MSKPKIFISYKRNHDATSEYLVSLESTLMAGGFAVLRDDRIEPGSNWSDELWRWLVECSAAVVLMSRASIESDWTRREHSVLRARNAVTGLSVVPVWVEERGNYDAADILAGLQSLGPDSNSPAEVLKVLGDVADGPMTVDDYLAAHQSWLQWQFEEAQVLGHEPFSLSQVYIPTECGQLTWREISRGASGERKKDPFDPEQGGRQDLLAATMKTLQDPKFRDLVVVQGPAGCGKSAFTLRLAMELLKSGQMPVLVRFRDLRLAENPGVFDALSDAIRVAPIGENPPRPTDEIFPVGRLERAGQWPGVGELVVILDGWDEVTLTGNTSYRAQLESWLPRLRQALTDKTGLPLRVLLTGRPSVDLNTGGFLRLDSEVLTIRPIRPDQVRKYAHNVATSLEVANWVEPANQWVLDIASCEPAFTQYEQWFNEPSGGGIDVLGSPLLTLLGLRTFAVSEVAISELVQRPSALYHELINVTVANAGKADEGPEGTVHRGGRSLRRLLQRVASIMTMMGGESIAFAELNLRLEDDQAIADWASEATNSADSLYELVVNFYFRSHPELGCEFLHKSFREYLHAESVVALLEKVSEGEAGFLPPPGLDHWEDFMEGTPHYTVSRELATLAGPHFLTPEVLDHVIWLLDSGLSKEPNRYEWLTYLLVDVYCWWFEGVHLRLRPRKERGKRRLNPPAIVDFLKEAMPYDETASLVPIRSTTIDSNLGHCLIQLTGYLCSKFASLTADDRRYLSDRSGRTLFRPVNAFGPQLTARLVSSGWTPTNGLTLPGSDLDGADLTGANLTRADLTGANLNRADLTGAILTGADLTGAILTRAELTRANLTGADLTRADLTRANLDRAELNGANLTGANLYRAELTRADLTGANLAGANLDRADLTRADLTGANLTGANFDRAELNGANLYRIILDRADPTGAISSTAPT